MCFVPAFSHSTVVSSGHLVTGLVWVCQRLGGKSWGIESLGGWGNTEEGKEHIWSLVWERVRWWLGLITRWLTLANGQLINSIPYSFHHPGNVFMELNPPHLALPSCTLMSKKQQIFLIFVFCVLLVTSWLWFLGCRRHYAPQIMFYFALFYGWRNWVLKRLRLRRKEAGS